MEQVTVLNTEGVLLAAGNELADTAPGGMLTLERTVSQEILDNVRKTLTPYLGLRNFQVSVAARLNTDKKQTNETIFNPELAGRAIRQGRRGKARVSQNKQISRRRRWSATCRRSRSRPTTASNRPRRPRKTKS